MILSAQEEAVVARVVEMVKAQGAQTYEWTHPEVVDMIKDITKAKVRAVLADKPNNIYVRQDYASNPHKVSFGPTNAIGTPPPSSAPAPAPKKEPAKAPVQKGIPTFKKHTYHPPVFHDDLVRAITDPGSLIVCGVGPTGSGKCVDGDTMVPTSEGIKEIKDFMVTNAAESDDYANLGIGVAGINGNEMTSHFYNGGVKRTWKVTTRQGYEIIGTAVHRVVSVGNVGPEWRYLPNFKIGDRVLIKSGTEMYGNKPHGIVWANGTDFDVGYVLGFWVGEGSIGYRSRKNGKIAYDVRFAAGANTDRKYIDGYVAPLIESVAGKTVKTYGPYGKNTDISLEFLNREIAEWMIANCGVGAENKFVPKVVLEGTKEIQQGFISGYMDADGFNNKGSEIEMGTNSERLAKTLRVMLLNMGIVTSLGRRKSGACRVFVRGRWMRKFIAETNCHLERKFALADSCGKWSTIDTVPFIGAVAKELYNRLQEAHTSKKSPCKDAWTYKKRGKVGRAYLKRSDVAPFVPTVLAEMAESDNFWDEVVTVEDAGERQVYDLTVPGTQSFVANGFMNHNTEHMRLVSAQLGMELTLVNCRKDMDSAGFTGEKTVEPDAETKASVIKFLYGPVVRAMRTGMDKDGNEVGPPALLVLDEFPIIPSWLGMTLNNLLECTGQRRRLVLPENGGETVTAHSGFRIVLLGNTIGRGTTMAQAEYTAQGDSLDISTLDRISAIFNYGYSRKAEEQVLSEKIGDDRVVAKVLKLRDAVRAARKQQGLRTPFSTRLLVSFADGYRVFGGDAGKAFVYVVLNKLMPEERAVYSELFFQTFGQRIEMLTASSEVDYDY